jgi:hypothetical protein
MLLEYAKAFCKRMEQWTPRPLRAAWCFPKLTSVDPLTCALSVKPTR